jgi:hypothetical protein
MTWQLMLRVGDTSAYDITLTSLPYMVIGYPLASPVVDQQTIQNLGDGNTLSIPTFANVIESIDLHIGGPGHTSTQVQAAVRAIERVVDLARQSSIGYLTDKVYLRIRYDQDTEWWRSQILAAQWAGPNVTGQIWKNFETGSIELTRRFYWETEILHPVAISSGPTPTPTTGYATVYNADDSHGANQNWWQLAADQVQGSLPAPARISLKAPNGARGVTFYLANYVFANPTTVDPIFRGNQSIGGSTPGPTEQPLAEWSLGDNNLTDAFKGQFGRVVVVYSNRPDPTTLLRAAVNFQFVAGVSIPMALGDPQLNANSDFVQDLGAVPIPPGNNWQDAQGVNLVVTARTPGPIDTCAINYIMVMPGTAGRFRLLRAVVGGLLLGDGDEMVDDGPEDSVYAASTAGREPVYRGYFNPIYLWPNLVQRLRFLVTGGNWEFEQNLAWQVKVEVRYRRLTI